MDPDRCFLRLAVDRGLAPTALAEECAALAPPGGAARLLVERARISPELARALFVEAQRLARAGSGELSSSLAGSVAVQNAAALAGSGRGPAAAAATAGGGGGHTVVGRPGASSLQAGSMFGRYRLEQELGRGAMGIVWRAHHQDLDRTVALKMLAPGRLSDERQRQRFQAEARAVARLSHESIVGLFEVGELEGIPFFTMEYVDGGSLADVPLGEPIDLERALAIGIGIADALECAHQAGIVHRDLKPANVLLARDGSPRLTDFGIAKDLQGALPPLEALTQSGEILGTPAYMSPEQANGQKEGIDGRTDVYALGAILYRLLTGRPPFEASTPYEVLRKVLASAVIPPRRLGVEVPAEVEQIVLRCLEKDRGRRFESAAELREALRDAREALVPEAAPAVVAGGGPPAWFWPALLVGLLLVGGGGLGVAWLRERARVQAEQAERERLQAEQRAREQAAIDEARRAARAALDLARSDPRGALQRAEEAARAAPAVAEVQTALGRLRLEVAGDAQGALVALDTALGLEPGDAQARAARGRCLVRLGREPSEVQPDIDRLEQGDLMAKAAAAELRGELALRDGKTAVAAAQLGEAVRRFPDDARLRRRLARAYLGQRRHEQALEELDHARQLDAGSVEERALRAQALLALDRRQEARAAAEEALNLDGSSAEAAQVLAQLGRHRERPPPTPAPPPEADDHGQTAHDHVHAALKALEEGIARREALPRILQLWDACLVERRLECKGALMQRIVLARRLHRFPDARADLDQLRRLPGGETASVVLALGEVDLELNRLSDVEAESLRAAELDPRSPGPPLLLAKLRERQRRVDDALAAWNRAVELAPQDGELVHDRGHFFQRLHRPEDALRDMQQACQLGGPQPGHYMALCGDLLAELSRPEEARPAWEKALGLGLTPQEEKHVREALARLQGGSSEQPR